MVHLPPGHINIGFKILHVEDDPFDRSDIESTTVLANFLAHIDDSKAALLKHIGMSPFGHTLNTAPAAATQLLKAVNLRTLGLPHRVFCSPKLETGKPQIDVHKVVETFGKILGPLKASHETQNMKVNVLDVLVLDLVGTEGCDEWNFGGEEDDIAEACNQRRQKERRDAVAEYLGIAEAGDVAEDGKPEPAEANGSVN